jgi:murein L,D-transpeptidase YafK
MTFLTTVNRSLLWLQPLTAICMIVAAGITRADPAPWILVDTHTATVSVNVADRTLETFDGIAIGRNGTAKNHFEGDGKTPLGTFEVAWINDKSNYHLFFGLNYPTRERAERAFRSHLIDLKTYLDIQLAFDKHEVPPQDTPLGGFIGIHGLGKADPAIHESANWTKGCVALTDSQIERLATWIKPGTKVVIR